MDLISLVIYLSLVVISIAPIRFAYVVLASLAFFDASGPQFASASSLGLANAFKVLLAPLILLVRLRGAPLLFLLHIGRQSGQVWLFVFLTLFASLAVLWSPEFLRLGAIKGAAYLWGYLVWFAVLSYGWFTGRVGLNLLFNLWGVGLLLGIIQTSFFGAVFGKGLYEEHLRFTAFSSPQSYAAFYVYLLALFLFLERRFSFISLFVLLCTFALIVLTGSRYSLVTAIWVTSAWALYYLRSAFSLGEALKRFYSVMLFVLMALASLSILGPFLGSTRVVELFEKDWKVSEVGTFAWRIGMWSEAWGQIEEFSLGELVWGRGTAASALVALRYDPRYEEDTIDANRVMHNEFLRALYEWGIIGFGLFFTFVLGLFVLAVKWLIAGQDMGFFLLAILGPLMVGIFIENILAASGSPVGIGISLALAYLWYKKNVSIYAHPQASHSLPATGR
jgi:O-antigen ligase